MSGEKRLSEFLSAIETWKACKNLVEIEENENVDQIEYLVCFKGGSCNLINAMISICRQLFLLKNDLVILYK